MNIVIFDKQFIFREGIKSILRELNDYNIVAESEIISNLDSLLSFHKPDMLIGDLVSETDLAHLKQIEKSFPEINILIITNEIKDELIIRTLEIINVKGYFLKDSRKVDLVTAITIITNNGKSFCHQVIDCLHRNLYQKNAINLQPLQKQKELTLRETEIVKLVAEGKTAKEIAEKLFISIHTVNTYRKNVLKKLEVKNSSELVMFAIKNKIIDSTEYYI